MCSNSKLVSIWELSLMLDGIEVAGTNKLAPVRKRNLLLVKFVAQQFHPAVDVHDYICLGCGAGAGVFPSGGLPCKVPTTWSSTECVRQQPRQGSGAQQLHVFNCTGAPERMALNSAHA